MVRRLKIGELFGFKKKCLLDSVADGIGESSNPQSHDVQMPPKQKNGTLSTQFELLLTKPSSNPNQDRVYLGASILSLGLLIGSSAIPILAPLSTIAILYASIPFFKSGLYDIFYGRRVTMGLMDMIVMPTVVLAGYPYPGIIAIGLIYLSKLILKKTEDHSKQSLVNLFGDLPNQVWVLVDGQEVQIPLEQLETGDQVVVHAGGVIPVDGVIAQGICSVDQRMLTGESQPVEKEEGGAVLAATTVIAGRIVIDVENAGAETTAAQIGSILTNTADFKLNVQSRGEAVGDQTAPWTLALGAVSIPFVGLARTLAILYSGIGYNMRLVAPVSMLNYLSIALRSGVLVKDARSFDTFKDVDTVIFDKTGTLTIEQPHVGQIYCYPTVNAPITEDMLLTYAAAAEYQQTHPIAKAILAEAKARGLSLDHIDDARYEIGYGLQVTLGDGTHVHVGSQRFMALSQIETPVDVQRLKEESQCKGHSLVMVAINGQFGGVIELVSTIRPEATTMIEQLHARGLTLYVISGDQEEPTRTLADLLNIDHYFANTLPEGKADHIEKLQAEGRTVCFIGDGINDAVALKQADVSISLSGASTIATDAAQIILMHGNVSQMANLFRMADSYEQNMTANLWLALVPGVVCVGGVYFLNFGISAAIALYNAGLAASIGNALLPQLQYRTKKQS